MSGGGEDKVKETAMEKELANQGMMEYERFRTKIAPIRDQFISRVGASHKTLTQDAGRGANMGMQVGIKSALDQSMAMNANRGVNPGSKSFVGDAVNAMSPGQGALSMVDAKNMADTKYAQGIQGVVDLGRGQGAEGLAGMTNAAGTAASASANRVFADRLKRNDYLNAAGTAAGIGTSAYLNRTPTMQPAGGVTTTPLDPYPQMKETQITWNNQNPPYRYP